MAFEKVLAAALNELNADSDLDRIVQAGVLNEWISRELTHQIKLERARLIGDMIAGGATVGDIAKATGLGLSRIAKYRDVYDKEVTA